MTSLVRGLEVLRVFAGAEEGMTASKICRHTGLSRAVVRRCLYTLMQAGYVEKFDDRYQPTVKVLSLAQPYCSAAQSLPAVAQPFLESLSQEINESCSVAVLDGDDVVYVARAATKRIMTISLTIGSRLPAYCTSLGRILLSERSSEELESYLERITFEQHTVNSITTKRDWKKEMARVRDEGFAMIDEELEIGLRSIAVPVLGPQTKMLAAMNVGVQATRVNKTALKKQILPALQATAASLSRRLAELHAVGSLGD
ncbi:MAG: IclR family transcriptional regulator C-terminal domain-containing protein [Planctomycetota bacterium]